MTLPTTSETVPLGELLSEVQAGFASGERAGDGVLQVRMNNVDTHGGWVWDKLTRIPATAEQITDYGLRPGDVMFNNTNSTALVGKSALFTGFAEPMLFSNHFTRLRTTPHRLSANYLAKWLNHTWQLGVFADICNRWIGQSAVKADKLLALRIPLPPLAEQERIATELTSGMAEVDYARRAAEERLFAAEALPAAYLRDVFEGTDAEGWEVVELSQLVRSPIRTGLSKTGRPDSEFSCLTLSAVRGRTLDITAAKPVDVTEKEAEGNSVRPGCFYVVRGNGNRELVGRGAFAPDPLPRPMLFPDLLFQLDMKSSVDADFFWCLWSSAGVRREIEQRARTAAGIYKINTGNLNSLPLRMPTPKTQAAVARHLIGQLNAANALIARCREELAAVKALPAALLRRAFGSIV